MALNLTNSIDHQCVNAHLYSQNFASVKLRFSPTITILIYSIYLLPFCFGIFGNISVCLIFFQQRKLRSITNTFLMNLCLNDLIVLCVSIPMTLSAALLEHWIFGAFLCKLVNFTPTLTALVSTFTVAIISVERWSFIVNKKKFDRHGTIVTLVLLWTVSILIALPEFISRHIEEFAPPPLQFSMMKINSSLNNNNNNTDLSTMDMIKPSCQMKKVYFCVLNPGLRMRIFSYIVITVQYLVPFLFVSVSCYSISRFLKRRMKQMRAYQTHDSTSSYNNNNNPKREKKTKLQCQNFQFDGISEKRCTSYEELPVTIITNENKSNNLLTCIRNIFQNGEEHGQNSIVLDQQSHALSSDVNTVLMPKVKNQSHSERRFHRSRKLLICVAALFTISWLPLTVVQIYLEHNEEITRDEPNFVYAFLLIPCYLISSLSAWMNPVIYNYINRSFRREFYALYPCCCKLTSSLSSPSSVHERTTIPSVTTKRAQIQTLRDIEENTIVSLPRPKNKLGARFITFADGETKSVATVMINEHI
ncbi:unnamed protein product [Rotaria sp. Silwood2]|nr:unnamed protein product [Rotaria sp. Silwood2]CAF2569974.1 unnamed protein product [Rotaria sp. Silwood2]CAF4194738.1 unnamed protein product [Rotaria sp. Silwood2]CAF4354887.1 unnamed protein product [Rotaria sp. Silwood2]CAF4568424.1 unnamed protein product [Rotaria sp. Silwood2]